MFDSSSNTAIKVIVMMSYRKVEMLYTHRYNNSTELRAQNLYG